jgi:RNA polymerase sigma factor (sigma-70 family)
MMDSRKTRQSLLESLRDRYDERSWEDFVGYYRPYIYGIVRSQDVGADDREDIVQDVLIKAWKALPSYSYDRSRCRFRSWLAVVTRNAVRDFRKRKSTRQRSSQISLDDTTDIALDPEIQEISDREWKQHISQLAYQQVAPKFAENVLEVFWALSRGATSREVAEQFEIKENTANVYRSRVQKALMKEIIRLEDDLG